MLFSSYTMSAQQDKIITGIVTSATDAMPLPGVNITIKGTPTGIVTGVNGDYSIKATSNDVLVFSYIGHLNQEVTVGNKSQVNIALKSELTSLTEVIVVGYGKQKKKTLTGAVSMVQGKDLVKSPVTNVSQSIGGRVPGVVAISGTGEPGSDGVTLRVRGVNTFGNSSPLIVVDGVAGRSLERIDPSTIDNISVLKDASAAIYGAQAANGVILITTKRGTSGKPKVSLSFNQGFSGPTILPKMASSSEYATLLNEIDKYASRTERFTADEIQKFSDGSDPLRYPNTDWFKETLKPWSAQNYANLSVSGGSDAVKYFVNLSQKSQDGFYRNSATKYKQTDFRSNLDIKVNDYVNLTFDLNASLEDRNYPTRSAQSIFRMVMRGKPNLLAYWPNGLPGPDIEFGDNPVVTATDATGYDKDKKYNLNSNFGINIKVPGVDGLTFTGKATVDKGYRFNKRWETPWTLYSWDGSSLDAQGEPVLLPGQKGFSDARLTETFNDSQNITLNGLLNYSKTINENHDINFLVGAEKITSKGDYFSAYRRNYVSTAIDQLFAGGQKDISNNGSASEEARLSYLGRVNYSFKNKYLAEFVWRYQGSYIFDKSSRYGFFPGVSLGYVLSEEKFWKDNVSFISFAKLRASAGKTGNDLINPYQYLASYSVNNLVYISNGGSNLEQGLYEGVLPNTGVTWETAIQKNIGIDADFLNGDLTLTADYFINLRKDILWKRNASIPTSAGLTLPDENIGKVENKGIDFNIVYKHKINDFKYSIGFNSLFAKNKILFWDEAPGAIAYQQTTGRPIGAQLLYNSIGVFKDQAAVDAYPHWQGARPGDVIFEDVNKDNVIDANDKVRFDKSGTPTFTGGLNLDFSYKGFDLGILLQGATGGVFYESTESGELGNFLKSFYDNRWTEANPNSEHPRTFNRSNEYWVANGNTYWLHKTDYIRVKNIELGYTLPETLTSKANFQKVRIYVSAFNFLTYSPDMKDFDPENVSGNGQNYPLNKVVNFGFNINF
ncbi:TonB-dependent receptor [Flavobacterium gawalongense]|uniref:TonB-dependent receptor n=2 Tax=Flavobacterium gawalongense TaxID=2594432 RepID=A0ABY3CL66_9FLAO|nr:TonB-dependent receptor [Flavobacterium gawalongense]TRX06359.1 TonB-dependent receptor [Flavobacterium gawalongense]